MVDSLVSMVYWEEDQRFQPAQPDEDRDGNEFLRRTFDIDGVLDMAKASLAALQYAIEHDLCDDDQLEIAEEQQAVYEELVA